jgi:hypothetical protein
MTKREAKIEALQSAAAEIRAMADNELDDINGRKVGKALEELSLQLRRKWIKLEKTKHCDLSLCSHVR